jgi:hypothetical protein
MDDFFNLFHADSRRSGKSFAQPRIGVVTSSDTKTATAKVLLQPEGILTGWLPVLSQWTGAGWGMSCPPNPGDQVLIIPQEGDAQHGLIVGRLYSNLTRPPEAAPGEVTLTHVSGCSIRLLNSGIVSITGDLHVSGDVYDGHGSLGKLRNDYNIHVHETNSGEATSGPSPQD